MGNAVMSSRVGELMKDVCACASQRPLMRVRPLPSTTKAPCSVSGASLLPTLMIRFPLTSTSPRYGAAPVESRILTSTNATIVSSLSDLISTLGTFRRGSTLVYSSTVSLFISRLSYFYQINSTERRVIGIPYLSQPVNIHRLGGLQGCSGCNHPIHSQHHGRKVVAGASGAPSRGYPCARRRDGCWIPASRRSTYQTTYANF